MNELIQVNYDNQDRPTVSGRELYQVLDIKTEYMKWFQRMCEYGFEEEKDFSSFLTESTGGRPSTDHQLTIDMAKEIAMIQRNEKGKQVRQYFLEVERRWNNPASIMARALKLANNQLLEAKQNISQLENKIEADKPKVLFAEAVSVSDTCILIGDLAKILKQNGVETGQKRLFETLRNDGFLIKRKGLDYNSPTQRSMEQGLFEIKETAITHSDGHVTINKTTKVTGKGQIYFINKFLHTTEEQSSND